MSMQTITDQLKYFMEDSDPETLAVVLAKLRAAEALATAIEEQAPNDVRDLKLNAYRAAGVVK